MPRWRVGTFSDENACWALSACWRVLDFAALVCGWNRRHTLSNPRKVLTRDHSSLVSFSSRILSRFEESCSSQRSSSTKASTHYKNPKKQNININPRLGLATHLFLSFGAIKHEICRRPPYLHIQYKLNRGRVICLDLNRSPHFFSLWWWAFLIRNER